MDTFHVLGIALNQVQDLGIWPCWPSWGSHGATSPVCPGPFPPACWPHHTTQLGVTGKAAEGVLNPTVHVASKYVNSDSSSSDPQECHTSPSTGVHSHIKLLATALWVWPSSHFLTPRVVHLSNPCLSSSESRVLCRRVTNIWHKSRQMMTLALPLSTNTVTSLQKASIFARDDSPLVKPCWLSPHLQLPKAAWLFKLQCHLWKLKLFKRPPS